MVTERPPALRGGNTVKSMKAVFTRTIFGSILLFCCIASFSLPATGYSDTGKEMVEINAVLDKECVRLKKEKIKNLLLIRFSPDSDKRFSPVFLKIVEKVVRKADFENVTEEKTVEVIGLVYESSKRDAPLEYVEQMLDIIVYAAVPPDSLVAAAKALQDFHNSDVPQDIAEGFIARALDDAWKPASILELSRGLIYGVERGLTPRKVSLRIMRDVKRGKLKKKSPDQLALDAVKFVRKREPKKWKPLTPKEQEMLAKQECRRQLESRLQLSAADTKQKENEKTAAEEKLRQQGRSEGEQAARIAQENIIRQLESHLKTAHAEAIQLATEQKVLEAELTAFEQEKLQRIRERQALRKKQLEDMGRSIATDAKKGQLDLDKLYTIVEQFLGVPYRYGGDSDKGLDCSAFTRRIYRAQNIELPRSTLAQSLVGFSVDESGIQPGDLLFFDSSTRGRVSHVGVYLGDGIFAHASSRTGVTKSNLYEKYYLKRFIRASRIFEL